MRALFIGLISVCIISFIGCETVHEGAKVGGSVVGKTADTIGGVTEGAAEAMQGEITPAENPYGR